MTNPELSPDEEAKRVNWLFKYIDVQQVYDKKIISALQQASVDAGEAAAKFQGNDNVSSRVAVYQSSLVRNEIRKIMRDLYKSFVPIINAGQQDAAEAAAKASLQEDAKVLEALFPDAKERAKWQDSFKQSARHGIQAMITRVLHTNQPLSTRIWNSGALSSGVLDRKINSALARGASAKDLAKLVSSDVKYGAPGGTSYSALRLARTEINNAFHAQSIGQAQDSPWVDDMEWHESKTHKPNPGDLCESYALERLFPKGDVPPKPHPQCMCYVTPVEQDWNTFASQLSSGAYDDFFEKKYGMPAA